MLWSKKVGKLRLDDETEKQTNEIKIAAPLLAPIDIDGRVITADALLTQRTFARYLVEQRRAHYHFTVKSNQKLMLEDIEDFFAERLCSEPNATMTDCGHGRVEVRNIWTTTQLNDYLDFPYVAQAFAIERQVTIKKSGRCSREIIYGVTSQTDDDADPLSVLKTNRNHWCIENSCHYILDWNFDDEHAPGLRLPEINQKLAWQRGSLVVRTN